MALTAAETPVTTTGAGAVVSAALNGSPSCTSTGYPIHRARLRSLKGLDRPRTVSVIFIALVRGT